MSRLVAPVTPALKDPDADRVRRELTAKVTELQRLPLAEAVIVAGVSLANGVPTTIAHRLGRAPKLVLPSCVRGPTTTGRIEEVLTGGHDRKQFVVLEANGWGATIGLDLLVA